MYLLSEGATGDSYEFNDSLIKNLTGEETVKARALYQNPVEFELIIKLHFLTNYVPQTGSDISMKRRLHYLFFNSKFCDKPDPKCKNEFQKDPEFIKRLKTEHLSEVFSWIIKGGVEFYKNPVFIKPPKFFKKTEEVLSQGDSIDTFITRKLIITKNDKDIMKKGELFKTYQ